MYTARQKLVAFPRHAAADHTAARLPYGCPSLAKPRARQAEAAEARSRANSAAAEAARSERAASSPEEKVGRRSVLGLHGGPHLFALAMKSNQWRISPFLFASQ